MSIVSSVRDTHPQADGRRWVHERHTDHLGVIHPRAWLAAAAENLDTAMAAYAVLLVALLREAEINRNIAAVLADGRLAVTTTQHSTAAENFAELRSRYASMTRVEAIFAGDFLGSLTDAQLRTAFSMTQAQVNSLRTSKLTPATNAATTIRATTGA